jgi:hypothetical protein
MASELRVNTLKDASGNNSVATSTVAQGSAKGWVNFNGTATFDSSDTEIRGSFNITSTVEGPNNGDYDFSYTTNMADANYAVAGIANGSGYSNSMVNLDGAITASTVLLRTLNTADARQDSDHILVVVHGDLA